MPKGVEHELAKLEPRAAAQPQNSVMPKGVEHMPLTHVTLLATAPAKLRDAERR